MMEQVKNNDGQTTNKPAKGGDDNSRLHRIHQLKIIKAHGAKTAKKFRLNLFFGVLLFLVVFLTDILVASGINVWILYIFPLMLLSSSLPKSYYLIYYTAASSLAIIIGMFFSPPGGVPGVILTNRLLGIVTLWLVAFLLIKRQEAELLCLALNKELEKYARERTSELEEVSGALSSERKRLAALMSNMQLGVVIAEAPSGRIVYENEQAERIRGRSFFEASGLAEYDEFRSFHADGSRYLAAEIPLARSIQKGEVINNEEMQIIRADGSRGVISVNSAPIRDEQGQITAAITIFNDITDRKKAESALVENEQRMQATLRMSRLVAWSWDVEKREFHVTENFTELFGIPPFRRPEEILALIHPEDVEHYRAAAERAASEGGIYSIEFRAVNPRNGAVMWLEERGDVQKDNTGRVTRLFGITIDITERKMMEEKIQHIARHDDLTGLPNRRLFAEIASHQLAEARRTDQKLAVLFLDLDRFKQINDTLGHETGDALLIQVAQRLKTSLRESDTVARIGGDEFNIVIGSIKRLEDVTSTIFKIIDVFQKPYFVDHQEFHVTTSIGISVYPDDSSELETLFRYADIALFHAKGRGRNTFYFYNPTIDLQSLDRIQMENNLLHAIERGELRVYYQPQVEIETGKIICAEALVRWQHPDMGLLDPQRFIPTAEEIGFVTMIDEWVLRTACTQFKKWQDKGLKPVCVTVNLSAREFQKPNMVEDLARILAETGLAPNHLELEITESLAMSNVDRTINFLVRLSKLGIRVSIDDFGTGYSSLNYLKRLPIHRLKIDKSFIRDIATDQDDRAIIKAITIMAHSLKLLVVAEGVENEAQRDFLHETRCDQAQGNLFNRPLPPELFEELLHTD